MKAILIVAALFAVANAVFISVQLNRMAYQLTLTNCISLAESGITCKAAGGDKPRRADSDETTQSGSGGPGRG